MACGVVASRRDGPGGEGEQGSLTAMRRRFQPAEEKRIRPSVGERGSEGNHSPGKYTNRTIFFNGLLGVAIRGIRRRQLRKAGCCHGREGGLDEVGMCAGWKIPWHFRFLAERRADGALLSP